MSSHQPSQGFTLISALSLIVGIASLGLAIEVHAIYFVYGLVQIVTGIGLWYRSHWGWYLGLFAYSIGCINGIYGISTSSPSGVINLAFNSVIVYYIISRKSGYLFTPNTTSRTT
jgi:uncharacterized membrane protein (DUF2068 family)